MILTNDGKEILAIYSQDGSEIEEVPDANGRIVYSALREITGTLPLFFYSLGKPLTDYLISGNTLQDGTPTPEAPVDVVGCGVRTENLFDISALMKGYYRQYQYYPDDTYRCFSLLLPAGTYTILAKSDILTIRLLRVSSTSLGSNGVNLDNQSYTFTLPATETIYVSLRNSTTTDDFTGLTIMLNTGSTVLPYEPYGYKLPLTVNGTEYPIYLGAVPTRRRIKKLVLTGEEDILRPTARVFRLPVSDAAETSGKTVVCTHFSGVDNTENPSVYLGSNEICVSLSESINISRIYIKSETISTLDDFKTYLAAQYANGTPVTIWYVLAEPETAVVNEPLMKIGDYADTISFTQAGVTIPTVSGDNVLDMSSTVKPSEMYIKGKGIKPIGNGG